VIYNIQENPAVLGELSQRELCELCQIIIKCIFRYFQEILILELHPEIPKLCEHLSSLQWFLGHIGQIRSKYNDPLPIIIFHNFIIKIVDNKQILPELKLKLDLQTFRQIGPIAVLKLLTNVLCDVLLSLDNRLHLPQETELLVRCMKRVEKVIHDVIEIFLDKPDHKGYLILKSSEVTILGYDLDIRQQGD
jgi:hypothetical protein